VNDNKEGIYELWTLSVYKGLITGPSTTFKPFNSCEEFFKLFLFFLIFVVEIYLDAFELTT